MRAEWFCRREHSGVRLFHANAFAEAGHEVRLFLLGEAVNLMKDEVMNAVTAGEKARCSCRGVPSRYSLGACATPYSSGM